MKFSYKFLNDNTAKSDFSPICIKLNDLKFPNGSLWNLK